MSNLTQQTNQWIRDFMYVNNVPPRLTSFVRVYPEYILYIVDTNVYLLSQDGKVSLYASWGAEDTLGVNIDFKCFDLLYKEEALRWKAPIKRYEKEEWRYYSRKHWKKEVTMFGFRHPHLQWKELM